MGWKSVKAVILKLIIVHKPLDWILKNKKIFK